jgi:hypothetical protein
MNIQPYVGSDFEPDRMVGRFEKPAPTKQRYLFPGDCRIAAAPHDGILGLYCFGITKLFSSLLLESRKTSLASEPLMLTSTKA